MENGWDGTYYWINWEQTTLDSNGDGWWNGQLYQSGSQIHSAGFFYGYWSWHGKLANGLISYDEGASRYYYVNGVQVTQYHYTNTASNNWDDSGNWYLDATHNVPAGVVPSTDYIFIDAQMDTGPSGTITATEINVGMARNVAFTIYINSIGGLFFYNNATNGGTLESAAFYNASINGATIISVATFSDVSVNNGTVTYGNFNSGSQNNNTVIDAEFHDTSINTSIVSGNASFYSDSSISSAGSVGGTATLYGSSVNYGSVGYGNFNNWSRNGYSGTVSGNAEFHDTSINTSIVSGNASFYSDSSISSAGSVGGTATLYGSSVNYGSVGYGNFNNWSRNGYSGTVSGNAEFHDGSQNSGNVSGTGTFYDNSSNNINEGAGNVTGNATFRGHSTNNGNVAANAYFYDYSANVMNGCNSPNGTVSGNAEFNDFSYNANSVQGNVKFNYLTAVNGVVTDITGYATGGVGGTIKDSAGEIINTWVFDTTDNNYVCQGHAVFNNGHVNKMSNCNATYQFYAGYVSGNATFNYLTAVNGEVVDTTGYAAGGVGGLIKDSTNATITTWIYGAGSVLISNVQGNAKFYDTAKLGSFGGYVTFNIAGNLTIYFPHRLVLTNDNNNCAINVGGTTTHVGYPSGGTGLYFFGYANSDWNDLNNWISDPSTETVASQLPVDGDTVYVESSVDTPSSNPLSLTQINVGIYNLAIFNVNTDNLSGPFTIGNKANLLGSTTGNATFNFSSSNSAVINGNVTFNEQSYNHGIITGSVSFKTPLPSLRVDIKGTVKVPALDVLGTGLL